MKPHAENEELKALMQTHGLRLKDVAEMLEVSMDTVKGWRRDPQSERYARMPRTALKLLKMQLEK